ncbi:MAG: glycosyltransferase family 2 protein [Bacteroidales bacterium]|nr:glycosyltransferase family 2 protein [Bacteroidales bacterium]
MPKVSVIVPNYNHAPYLKRRIDSILNQTYQDFELILLDDCSTDNSAEVLNGYANNPKVSHIVINETNSGSTFKQWDKGFALAKGEYIWVAESDDWCEKTLLENLVPALDNNPNVVLAYCQSLLVSETGYISYATPSDQFMNIQKGRDFVASQMFGDPVLVNAGMVVFRKAALDDIEEFYKTMKAGGDWMFWVNIALKGDVFSSAKGLNYCFRHLGTVTSKSERTGNDIKEGNLVYKFVFSQINPTKEEIKAALKKRWLNYFIQRKNYESSQVRKEAFDNIASLHPMSKRIYRKMMLYASLEKVVKRITRI